MVSIIVPVFNEKENLADLFSRIKSAFKKSGQDYEIVAIDDHSTDGTWELLGKLKAKYPLRFFKKEGIKGKAYSLIVKGSKKHKAIFWQ